MSEHSQVSSEKRTSDIIPTTRRPIALSFSIQFRWLIILALGPETCADACPQAREAFLGLRSKVREHLPIASIDLGKNFIDSRKHSLNNLDRFAPKSVEFDPQLLISRSHFSQRLSRSLMRHRVILFRPGIAQTAR